MRLRRLLPPLFAAIAALALMPAGPAAAAILISIDKAAQQMTVTVDGNPRYIWPVSTGARGYDTPDGDFRPFRMERDHFSREWDDAPMPHSIFFTQKGHAIHGSSHIKAIGTPASHGCVRLEPRNASILFALVKQEGMSNTRVVLTGETPVSAGVPVARRDRDYQRAYSNDDDITAALPPPPQRSARDWRDYNDGPRYYYRARPYYVRRYYVRHYYGYGAPFPFPYGR